MTDLSPRPADDGIGPVPFSVDLHLALIRAYEVAIHANTRWYATWGLTPQQYNVMRILYFGEPEGVRLTDVGVRLLQRVPDVSRLVDRLVAAGLAHRSPDPHDRRASRVGLTERGRRLVAEMDAPLLAAHEQWYAGLSSREQRQLESLLRKAAAGIRAAMEDGPERGDAPAPPDHHRRGARHGSRVHTRP